MFTASRRAVFDTLKFRETGGDVDFVEALQYENIKPQGVNNDNFRHGSLEGEDILRWVSGSKASPLKQPGSKDQLVGKIRLLICERSQYEPLDFSFSRAIFEEVEQAFHLHPATLSIFESNAGTFSRYLTFCKTDRTKLKRIAIILKAPQKREIANYGLSLSYDVESCTTTALLHGGEVLIRPGAAQRMYRYQYTPPIKIPALLDLLMDAMHAWNHPLLLPALLLEHHMYRIKAFTNYSTFGTMVHETMKIEGELGVTKVGQTGKIFPLSESKGRDLRVRAEDLTVRINTHSTVIIYTVRSPEWNLECSEFALKLLRQLEAYLIGHSEVHHELKELLETNMAFAEAAAHAVTSVRERMALQLNVLYNLVAQMDNALSAQLAAAAGRDSTSMKILAFISAIFLPGSFVAGIFSMSMFDWQYSAANGSSDAEGSGPGGENRVVSSRFWVYWATALPLTLITLLGWGFWWRLEMRRYQQKFKVAMSHTAPNEDEDVEKTRSWNTKVMRKVDGKEAV